MGDYTWQGIYIAVVCGLILQAVGYFSYVAIPWTQNPADIQHWTYVYIKWRSLSAVGSS